MRDVEPFAAPGVPKVCLALRDLVGMVRKDVVNAAAMDVKMLAEMLHRDAGALDVPAGVANAEGAVPLQLLIVKLRLGEPKNEVGLVALVGILVDPLADADLKVLLLKGVEGVVLARLRGVKIDISSRLVGVALFKKRLDHVHELADLARCGNDDLGDLDVQALAVGKEGVGIELRDLHDRLLLALCTLEHLVLACVGVAGQMTDVGDIHGARYLVTEVAKRSLERILHDIGAQISDMREMIDGRAAGIHLDLARGMRHELLAPMGQGIIEQHGNFLSSRISLAVRFHSFLP